MVLRSRAAKPTRQTLLQRGRPKIGRVVSRTAPGYVVFASLFVSIRLPAYPPNLSAASFCGDARRFLCNLHETPAGFRRDCCQAMREVLRSES